MNLKNTYNIIIGKNDESNISVILNRAVYNNNLYSTILSNLENKLQITLHLLIHIKTDSFPL